MNFWGMFSASVEVIVLTFSVFLSVSYLLFSVLSYVFIKRHMERHKVSQYDDLLRSNFAPSVSLIAPAYNEGTTIVDNIRSMLSLEYNNYEVIVINDGSKDNTMEQVIRAFDLVKVPLCINQKVPTKKIIAAYKSKNRAFKRLTILDKENGGKADALNAGINISKSRLVTCLDVDCVLENDALQRMVKPFMEDSSVIASGGVVRIANSCEVEHGKLVKVHLPKGLLVRIQVLEYLRAFLLGRMAWTKLNGLLLISGAFGMFDRRVIVEAGGYNTKTVGEDMELVVRMRSLMIKQNRKFKVSLIPDPLCWTEVPTNTPTLIRQRNRWARGTMEVLKNHKYMFFNPKYKVMGLFSYPFWFFFEWLAPLLECFGMSYFLLTILLGSASWSHFSTLFVLLYSFSFFISTFTLYAEELSFPKYSRFSDQFKLMLAALVEPFIYHPRVVIANLLGNIDFLRGDKSWGEMKRDGFTQQSKQLVKS